MPRNYCQTGYTGWQKNDGFRPRLLISASDKWVLYKKTAKPAFLRITHPDAAPSGDTALNVHGQALSKETIQTSNHERSATF